MSDAFREDFFQRIVDVNWGGGVVFIYATETGNQLNYVKITGGGRKAQGSIVALPGRTSKASIRGSSYAKVGSSGVFLVCAIENTSHTISDDLGNEITVVDSHTFIYRSTDGVDWMLARQQDAIIDIYDFQPGLNVVALVWKQEGKDGSFYYDQTHIEHFPLSPGDDTVKDEIFISSDGTGWSSYSSTETGADSGYVSAFPGLCSGNDCTDSRHQNVPDGVMRYDTKQKITARPLNPPTTMYEVGRIDYESPGSGDVEIIQREPAFSSPMSIPGIGLVTCVAGYDGIFMAGGYAGTTADGPGAVALSVDGGRTWVQFDTTADGVVTMVAAPTQDLKAQK